MIRAAEKPPYRVPSIAEIAKIKPNGFTVVSTFSGCGGSCLGFRMAGYKVLWASEFIPAARDTYLANYPQTPVDARDIRLVKAADIRKLIGKAEVDVLEGSPPCASFSTAGKRSAVWGAVRKYSDSEQRVDDLFFEYSRLVGELEPKVFVAENVSGLVKGVAKGYFKEILRDLKAKGYEVRAQVLDAQWLGVPQMRQRLIFVGVRQDLVDKYGVHPAHPVPLRYRYSVKDAIPWIDRAWEDASGDQSPTGGVGHLKTKTGAGFGWEEKPLSRPSPTIQTDSRYVQLGKDDATSPWQIQDRERRIDGSTPAPTVLTNGRGFSGIVVAKHGYKKIVKRASETPSPTVKTSPDSSSGKVRNVRAKIRVAKGFKDEEWVDAGTRPYPTVGSSPGFGCNLNNNGGKIRVSVGSTGNPDSDGWKDPKPRPVSMAAPTIGASPSSGNGRIPPSKVIETSGGETRERKLTIAELKRICAFPDDFVLTGSYSQQWERLGRAVPPLMMKSIADMIREKILDATRE